MLFLANMRFFPADLRGARVHFWFGVVGCDIVSLYWRVQTLIAFRKSLVLVMRFIPFFLRWLITAVGVDFWLSMI